MHSLGKTFLCVRVVFVCSRTNANRLEPQTDETHASTDQLCSNLDTSYRLDTSSNLFDTSITPRSGSSETITRPRQVTASTPGEDSLESELYNFDSILPSHFFQENLETDDLPNLETEDLRYLSSSDYDSETEEQRFINEKDF